MTGFAKYFQPEVLSKISRLELRARHVVEGLAAAGVKATAIDLVSGPK